MAIKYESKEILRLAYLAGMSQRKAQTLCKVSQPTVCKLYSNFTMAGEMPFSPDDVIFMVRQFTKHPHLYNSLPSQVAAHAAQNAQGAPVELMVA